MVEAVTFDSEEGKQIYRHSTSHVMAHAVKKLFPEAKLAIGPAIQDGFYYDFDIEKTFTPEDLAAIEKEMESHKEELAFREERDVQKRRCQTVWGQGRDIQGRTHK